MSDRKLKAWADAGLIDAATVARIQAWEAEHSRPIGVWAMMGLGALTIGLGVVSVVAANWDAIPGEVRLAIHLVLMIALMGWLGLRLTKRIASDYLNDAAIFVAAVLALTFFAHVGQVYQTSSPLWQPLLLWIIVASPLLLGFGRGWPVAGLWMAAVLGTALAHITEYGGADIFSSSSSTKPASPVVYWGLIFSVPMMVAAMAAFLRGRSGRPAFWRLLEHLSIISILASVSLFIIFRQFEGRASELFGSIAIQCLFLLGAAAVVYSQRRDRSGEATAAILAAAAAVHFVQALLLWMEGSWFGSLIFLALWGAVAASALYAHRRRTFQIAVALVALRIIVLSFELGGDLLGSGISLIFSGLIAMGVAWGAVRISKHYAPKKEVAA